MCWLPSIEHQIRLGAVRADRTRAKAVKGPASG